MKNQIQPSFQSPTTHLRTWESLIESHRLTTEAWEHIAQASRLLTMAESAMPSRHPGSARRTQSSTILKEKISLVNRVAHDIESTAGRLMLIFSQSQKPAS